VYIVLCSDASYYTGITNDTDRRLYEHNSGIDRFCYTYTRRPVRLVYAAEFTDPNEAIRWEKQIKGWSRAKKDALIRGDFAYIQKHAAQ
jgi:putative endonuclease